MDLSLIKEQTQDLAGARECVGRAVDTLKKSVALCAVTNVFEQFFFFAWGARLPENKCRTVHGEGCF